MKLNVGKKLAGGFLIICILLMIISTTAVISIKQINKSYSDLTERRTQILMNMKEVVNLATTQNNNMRGILLLKDHDSEQNLRAANARTNEILEETIQLMKIQEHKDDLMKIIERNQLYAERYENFFKLQKELTIDEQINFWRKNIEPIGLTIGPLAEQMATYSQNALEDATTENSEQVESISSTLVSMSIATNILAIIIGYIMWRMISKPIIRITEATQRMASGDLTLDPIDVRNRDELGTLADSFNKMVTTIRQLLQEVNMSTEQVAASSDQLMASAEQTSQATNQITTSIQEIAKGAETQGAGAAESSKALQEMMVGMQRMVDATSTVAEETDETSKETTAGNDSIQKTISQMDKIHLSVDNTATVIQQLNERSKEISNIIDVITSISEQTNLLALNATIEAARAGEHGKGFAVVADEVRKLAEQSKLSADQITRLIHEIQSDTTHAVSAMQLGTKEVETGLAIVQETGEGFQRIQKSIEQVTHQIQEMSAISEEMFASLEEVNASAEQVAHIAENSASNIQHAAAASEEQLASMEEISDSATSLARMSEKLLSQIRQFKI